MTERPSPKLLQAITDVLVGGNHLALLIGADHPPFWAEHTEALERYGAGDRYEIWCCWRAIMRLRMAVTEEALRD